MTPDEIRPSNIPESAQEKSSLTLTDAIFDALLKARRISSGVPLSFGKQDRRALDEAIDKAKEIWRDYKARAYRQSGFTYRDILDLDRQLRTYFSEWNWIVDNFDERLKNSLPFRKRGEKLMREAAEFENYLIAAERTEKSNLDCRTSAASQGAKGDEDSRKNRSLDSEPEQQKNTYRLHEKLCALEPPDDGASLSKKGKRPRRNLIRFPAGERWEIFQALWKNRPNPIDIRGFTQSEPRYVINDLRNLLREQGAKNLAERIKNQSGVGYYLDLPPNA